MLNLEHLFLYIVASQIKGFIDGNNLKRNVVSYLPRLKRFCFNIRSIIRAWNQIDISSDEDLQKTFQDFQDQQIVSCVIIFPEEKQAYCHVYSRPYTIRCYDDVANHFRVNSFQRFAMYLYMTKFILNISFSFKLLIRFQ